MIRPAISTAPAYRYRPALDGVRAAAVLAVMLFHGGVTFLPGGFLGVDAFFVVSGFLITSLLLAEAWTRGRIALGAFWERRARRLLPALMLMLVAVVIASRDLLDPTALPLLRGDAIAALFYIANWRMIYHGTDYFAQTAAPSVLQHTWSLGIEEQFYLIWPLITAAAVTFLTVRAARRALLALCLAGTAASALTAAILYRPDDVSRAYFGTDTRAQALLIGAALAVWLTRDERAATPGRVPAVAALGAVAGIAWLWTHAAGASAWLYHGGLTLAAVSVAVILAYVVQSPQSLPARVLAVAPAVWVGRISYGLYLWHWPLYAYLSADRTGLTGAGLLGARLAATFAAATVSYYIVELPIRQRVILPGHTRRWVPAAAGAVALAAAAGVTIAASTPGSSTAQNQAAPAVIVPTLSPRPHRDGITPPMQRPGRTPGAQPRIDIFGDSVAWTVGTYLPAHPGITVRVRAIQGCGVTLLSDILEEGTPHRLYPNCPTWPARWRKGVAADDPDVSVILLNRWEFMDARLDGEYHHVGQPEFDAYLTGQLDEAISIAGAGGAHVVLLTAAYTHRNETPAGGLYPEDQAERVDAWNALLGAEAARHPDRLTVLDLNRLVCPDGKFTWTVKGVGIRSDGLHFTPEGDQRIIAPWLLPQLAAIAQTGKPR